MNNGTNNGINKKIDEVNKKLTEIERLLKIVIRNQKQGHRYPDSYLEGYEQP